MTDHPDTYVARWRNAILDDRALSSSQKLVAIIMAQFADPETGRSCYPTNGAMAQRANLGVRTVQIARRALRDGGWIAQERANELAPSLYSLTFPAR